MKYLAIFLIYLSSLFSLSVLANEDTNFIQCADRDVQDELIGGWYLWEPYQFIKTTIYEHALVGMDVKIEEELAELVGVNLRLDKVSWSQHQNDLKSGDRDVAFGSTYDEARAEYVHFSVPYRFEENSLFIRNKTDKSLEFDNVEEFLAEVRLRNFRLGVVNGFVSADPRVNQFINDKVNDDIIFLAKSDLESLDSLIKGEIDGFIADRLVGASLIIHQNLGGKIREQKLNIKTPIHAMFSKKTVPVELVERFNKTIKEFVMSTKYKDIVKEYIYPILLLETINAKWFFIVGIIGTISFAISGVAIAARENSTLFGTFIFAMLPSVGGGVIRDMMINKGEVVGLFLQPIYMYCIMAVVVIGFGFARIFNIYKKPDKSEEVIYKFWDNVLVFSDSLGQAAFIVTGVVVVVIHKIGPLWLWAPFFAFITANGGGIIRDMLRRDRVISCMTGEISAEISLFWGFLFGLFLEHMAHNPTSDAIQLSVIVIVLGGFLTRIITYYYNISNIHFRPSRVRSTVFKD